MTADSLGGTCGLASLRWWDHAIFDPPYLPTCERNYRSGLAPRAVAGFGFSPLDGSTRQAFATVVATAPRWVIVFSDLEGTEAWLGDLAAAGLSRRRFGLWVKTNGAPQFSGDRPAQGAEGLAIAHGPGRSRWNGGGKKAAWTGPMAAVSGRPRHPCEKPVWLLRQLLRDFTDPGDLVVDPCAGSGALLEAAAWEGRAAIGWELDPRWAPVVQARLAAVVGSLGDRLPAVS